MRANSSTIRRQSLSHAESLCRLEGGHRPCWRLRNSGKHQDRPVSKYRLNAQKTSLSLRAVVFNRAAVRCWLGASKATTTTWSDSRCTVSAPSCTISSRMRSWTLLRTMIESKAFLRSGISLKCNSTLPVDFSEPVFLPSCLRPSRPCVYHLCTECLCVPFVRLLRFEMLRRKDLVPSPFNRRHQSSAHRGSVMMESGDLYWRVYAKGGLVTCIYADKISHDIWGWCTRKCGFKTDASCPIVCKVE